MTYKSLGKEIARLRKKHDMTLGECAEAVDIPGISGPRDMSDIEHNRRKVTLPEMNRLARVFHVHISHLARVLLDKEEAEEITAYEIMECTKKDIGPPIREESE